ncbi:MAG: hypothetical protein HOC71_03305, partial [Candidatus Latescibacteria bacterium]|nr:hypothetical protein [Candidatus Latescibacterota bacterium]
MDTLSKICRRQVLGMPFVLALAGKAENSFAAEKKKIAAIVTVYRYNSHAEVMIPKMIEGYEYYGKHHESLVEVVSMYTDTVPDIDLSRRDMAKYDVPIYPHIRDALTLGGNDLAVDGVVLIGEHGDYPLNEKGQKLYPRYRLYKEIMNVFRETGRSVPVFSDKHLSVDWNEAKWMYDQSHELNFPFMAGSSLPLWWRKPILELDLQTPVEKAIALYGNGGESSGIHALETLQCMVERRKGGETGVAAVQCLRG